MMGSLLWRGGEALELEALELEELFFWGNVTCIAGFAVVWSASPKNLNRPVALYIVQYSIPHVRPAPKPDMGRRRSRTT